MLKRFFISLLGTVAGIWISMFLVIFGGIMLVGVAVGKSTGDPAVKVEKKSILYFDLSGNIQERYQSQPFLSMIQNFEGKTLTLDEMLRSLSLAAYDDKIEGLYIHCGGSSLGVASREELLEAIARFKESGKWVTAYSDSYTQADYLVATSADSLYLNPVGSVDIHGIGGTVPFFKGLLDKAGIKMQIIKVGTFKSAVEPYVLTSMSEPARMQMKQYCDTIWAYVSGTIADNRGLGIAEVQALAPEMIFTREASTFVSDSLVDALRYERAVDSRLRELTDIKSDKDLRLVTPSEYLSSQWSAYSSAKDHIAVYYAIGEIVDSGEEGIVGSAVTSDIISLADDKNVRGLVLRVNSPGGSAFASEQIWEALQYFKSKKKPLYVSMGDYAASGGYYISCGADSIFADRTTITGSIGVFGMIPDFSGLITDRLGVEFSTVETNPNGAGISIMEAMTPAQHAAMQRSVETVYDLFTSRVAAGRGMDVDSVKAIAEGRVWVGSRAIQLGLVDRLGSLSVTVAAMADSLGLETDAVVRYPLGQEKFWEKILRETGSLDMARAAASDGLIDEATMRQLHFIKRLREMAPIQARMEEVYIK